MELEKLYSLLGKMVVLQLNDMITDEEFILYYLIIKERIDKITMGNV